MKPFLPDPKPEPAKKGGKSPQRSGKRVEKVVADKLGEQRTVGSGAFKKSNKNLTGDIDVHDNEGKAYIKLEVKTTGAVNAAGEKTYSLNEKVLKQMEEEAHVAGELGALVIHYKNGKSYVVMPFDDWKIMLADAKLGRSKAK
jgi:hypothetical protein